MGVVIEEMMEKLSGVNTESTLSITGVVRERSSKNPNLPTGDIEVVPESIEVLGKCRNVLLIKVSQYPLPYTRYKINLRSWLAVPVNDFCTVRDITASL